MKKFVLDEYLNNKVLAADILENDYDFISKSSHNDLKVLFSAPMSIVYFNNKPFHGTFTFIKQELKRVVLFPYIKKEDINILDPNNKRYCKNFLIDLYGKNYINTDIGPRWDIGEYYIGTYTYKYEQFETISGSISIERKNKKEAI